MIEIIVPILIDLILHQNFWRESNISNLKSIDDRHQFCDRANFLVFFLLCRLRFFFDDLTAEGAEGTEERDDRNE
ncbi:MULTISPECIES: hypothetical protein [Microcoleaceae]|uniref:hypothetical protein n=1 Tax=Microcoleaceae TaxID=1892252 RepID=UPI00187F6D6F|nr:hypothetical protein [Tychonema sp. LEGE 06208]MBE9164646.1 hypothetical protein [Tychonema sp. LEGE 06208]